MRRNPEFDQKLSHLLAKKILFFWIFMLIFSGVIRYGQAAIPGVHGGKVIRDQGRQFEIVANPGLHQIKVYAAPLVGPPSNTLTVYLRSQSRNKRPLRLTLSEVTRDSWVYTGLIPSQVLIRGGVELEIDLK
jgi:hypothetical protein